MAALGPIPSNADWFTAADGTRRRVRRWTAPQPFMAMLLLHTFGSHSGRYELAAGRMAVHGVTIEAFDLVGHGESEPGRRPTLTWAELVDDVEHRLAAIRADHPGLPVALYGHGLGGLVAVELLEREPPPADLAVLVAPTLDFSRRFSRWKLDLQRRLGKTTVALVDDPRALAADATLAESWATDPLVDLTYPTTFVLELLDVQRRLAAGYDRVTVPLFIKTAWSDALAEQRGFGSLLLADPPDRMNVGGDRHDGPNDEGWRKLADELGNWLVHMGRRHWPTSSPPEHDPHEAARMTRQEATAAFEAFVAEEPARLARFDALVARLGGPALTADTESMRRFGAWMVDAMAWGDPGDEPPAWAHAWPIARRLSSDSLWLVELAGTAFLARLREAIPALEWQLCTDRRDSYYNRPVLEPAHRLAGPLQRPITEALSETPNRDWLGESWPRVVGAAREAVERPRDEADHDALPLDEIAVDEYDHDRFNAQIWIPEGAEYVLGERLFEELPTRLARLKGIEDLVHEDREVMLIRVAADADLDQIRTRVVGVVRRMKAAAAKEPEPDDEERPAVR